MNNRVQNRSQLDVRAARLPDNDETEATDHFSNFKGTDASRNRGLGGKSVSNNQFSYID